jgi:hypothetical protein
LITVSFRAKSVELRLLALIDRDAIDPNTLATCGLEHFPEWLDQPP